MIIKCLGIVFFATICQGAVQVTPQYEKTPLCVEALKNSSLKKKHVHNLKNKCPLTQKLIFWNQYQESGSGGADFEEIMTFLHKNQAWPKTALLQQRAEEALDAKTPKEQILKWFQLFPPVTLGGKIYQIEALEEDKAKALAKEVWETHSFTQKQQTSFYGKYKKWLSLQNHQKRIESLAWQGNTQEIALMFPYISPQDRQLLHAISKRHWAKIPKAWHHHPLVLLHRLQDHIEKNDLEGADTLYQYAHNQKAHLDHPQAWVKAKHRLMHHHLRQKQYQKAYGVVSTHGLKDGADAIESEWFAGWIALRLLQNPAQAKPHLEAFYEKSQTPVYQAKAAYWLGYLEEQLGNLPLSKEWYEEGALHPLTFFGQMCLKRLKQPLAFPLKERDLNTCEGCSPEFKELDLAFRLLKHAGVSGYERNFLLHMAKEQELEADREHLLGLTQKYLPEITILVAKISGRKGFLSLKAAYPTLADHLVPKDLSPRLKPSLLNALIRQESGFHIQSQSPVGALGLMHLMPGTARDLAKKHGISLKHPKHLLHKPSLNVKLGTNYLTHLLKIFDGHVVLALAGYNAGPTRVKQWLQQFGDPRTGEIYVLDWLELVPYQETRTYVYRILECMPIYESLQ